MATGGVVLVTVDDAAAANDLKIVEVISPLVAVANGLTCDSDAVVVRTVPSEPTRPSASAIDRAVNPAVTRSICLSFNGWAALAAPAINGNAAMAKSNLFMLLSFLRPGRRCPGPHLPG